MQFQNLWALENRGWLRLIEMLLWIAPGLLALGGMVMRGETFRLSTRRQNLLREDSKPLPERRTRGSRSTFERFWNITD